MISVNPSTYVITVPQADLTPLGGTSYQLDTYAFHIWLKDWEDSEAGIYQPKTHNHNTVVTLGGIQYARIVEILSPYTVTFQDVGSPYKVFLIGSNNNILDKTNLNNVSVAPNNSAGLINVVEVQEAAFDGVISVDVNNVTGQAMAGVVYPAGTRAHPCNNMVDAMTIAAARGYREVFVYGNTTIGSESNIPGFLLRGTNKLACTVTLQSGAVLDNCMFRDLTIVGTLDSNAYVDECIVDSMDYVEGDLHSCEIEGTLTIKGSAGLEIFNCYSGRKGTADPAIIDMDTVATGAKNVAIHNWSGHVKIRNMTAGILGISCISGANIQLESTCTGGMIHITGNFKLVNQSAGADVRLAYQLTPGAIADAVLNELLSEHATAGSLGKTLTDLHDSEFAKETYNPVTKVWTRYRPDKTTVLKEFITETTTEQVDVVIGRDPQ